MVRVFGQPYFSRDVHCVAGGAVTRNPGRLDRPCSIRRTSVADAAHVLKHVHPAPTGSQLVVRWFMIAIYADLMAVALPLARQVAGK